MNNHFCGRATGGVNVVLLLLVLLLVLVAGAGAMGWQQWQAFSQRVAANERALAELQSARQQESSAVQEDVAQVRTRLDEIAEQSEQRKRLLATLQQSGQREWLLNEAETLARLAEERLLLTADLIAAGRLLEVADRTLARLNDPEVLPARRALAADMEAIRGARQVDVQALMLRLAALQDVVMDVAVPAAAGDVTVAADGNEREDGAGWQQLFANLPIRIQRQDGDHPLPLNAQQASLIRLSLDSSLQQARLALQQGKPAVWSQALAHAQSVTRQWLPTGQPRVKQLLASLEELEQASVDQALPDIGAGREAIRALQRDGRQTGPAAADGAPGKPAPAAEAPADEGNDGAEGNP